MLTRVLIRNGIRTLPAVIPKPSANVGVVIRYAGEDGWRIIRVDEDLPRRAPAVQARRQDWVGSLSA